MKNWKHSCRSSVISMRSDPPWYPRSSTPLNPFYPLFLFLSLFFLPPLLPPFYFFFLFFSFSLFFPSFLPLPLFFSPLSFFPYFLSFCFVGFLWKLNIRYMLWQENKENEINVKYIRIHVYEYTERILASNLPYRDRKPKYMSKFKEETWLWWQAIAPDPIPLPCALALPPLSLWDAITPSPC